MNKIQAINILTNLASKAVKGGVIDDIIEAGGVYNALMVLSKDIQPEEPKTNEDK